jgi:hypothetical protein
VGLREVAPRLGRNYLPFQILLDVVRKARHPALLASRDGRRCGKEHTDLSAGDH